MRPWKTFCPISIRNDAWCHVGFVHLRVHIGSVRAQSGADRSFAVSRLSWSNTGFLTYLHFLCHRSIFYGNIRSGE